MGEKEQGAAGEGGPGMASRSGAAEAGPGRPDSAPARVADGGGNAIGDSSVHGN